MFQFLIKQVLEQLTNIEELYFDIINHEDVINYCKFIQSKCYNCDGVIIFKNDIENKCIIIGNYFNDMIKYLTETYINDNHNNINEQNMLKEEEKILKWICSLCTHINNTTRDTCYMCNAYRMRAKLFE